MISMSSFVRLRPSIRVAQRSAPAVVRVGAEDVSSIVSAIDARAVALNDAVDRFIGDKFKVVTSAPTATQAFVAEFKVWYRKWQAWRLTFESIPFDEARETKTMRTEAEEQQHALFAWEARFEAVKSGKPIDWADEKTGGPEAPSGLIFIALAAILGGVVYYFARS